MAAMWSVVLIRLISILAVLAMATSTDTGKAGHSDQEAYYQREADRVTNLPGQPPVKFNHYAGYIKLSPNKEKALFYWFFEAREAAEEKPLVLWLNGGPGCSSVGSGAAQELGPFLIQNNDQVTYNKFSWNTAANVLFLEAPVGVGFSYTNNSKDLYKLGDQSTAIDSHAFLLGWFVRFPNFKLHDFYIAGESYAGHYVPQLADVIFDRNKGASKDSYINLKGFMIGNGAINEPSDTYGVFDYAWSHAIISDKVHHGLTHDCNLTSSANLTSDCINYLRDLLRAYSDINIYDIYVPVCLSDYINSSTPSRSSKLLFAGPRHNVLQELPSGYDPCSTGHVEHYFNRPDVQRALHANVTKLHYPYTICSNVIPIWNDSPDTVLPIIRKLLNAGLRIWLFSGDTDGRVPVTSTRYSINTMGLKVEQDWRAWFDNKQVAGWVQVYEGGLTFATVKGAGHQVPTYAPQQSLSLFSHFLSGLSLPSSRF